MSSGLPEKIRSRLVLEVGLIINTSQASNLAAATGRRCPACWPLCPRNILKSTASSGLPSTTEYSAYALEYQVYDL